MGKSISMGNTKSLKYDESTDATYEFTFVYGSADGNCKKLVATNVVPIGVTTETAEAGEIVPIRLSNAGGTCWATAGAAISYGAKLMIDSSGRVTTHDSNASKYMVGIALEAATAAGDYIEILLNPSNIVGV